MASDIEQLVERFREARDGLPLDIPGPYRDGLAMVSALGLEHIFGPPPVPMGPRCVEHLELPRCEICGVEIKRDLGTFGRP